MPVDFLIAANPHNPIGDHHEKLAANAFAQTEALMLGRSEQQAQEALRENGMGEAEALLLAPHKAFPETGQRAHFFILNSPPLYSGN